MKVDIEKKRVKVSHKTDSGSWTEIVNGDLPWEINKEESMWTLVPKEHVHVSFSYNNCNLLKCIHLWDG